MAEIAGADGSAHGGSAATQASAVDERVWRPRPFVAFVIRAATVVVPFAAAFLAVHVSAQLVPRPGGRVAFVVWLGALGALSMA